MNRFDAGGNLTKDPELKNLPGGRAVLNGSIALNESIPDGNGGFKKETVYIDFTIWGARATAFAKFHRKGSYALLMGKLTMDTWEDRATGKPRTKLKMTVQEWEFTGNSSKGDQAPPASSGTSSPWDTPEDDEQEETPF